MIILHINYLNSYPHDVKLKNQSHCCSVSSEVSDKSSFTGGLPSVLPYMVSVQDQTVGGH